MIQHRYNSTPKTPFDLFINRTHPLATLDYGQHARVLFSLPFWKRLHTPPTGPIFLASESLLLLSRLRLLARLNLTM